MTGNKWGDSDSTDPKTTDDNDTTGTTQAAVSTDYKVRGRKSATGGTGILGHNTASSGGSFGVEGQTDADGDVNNSIHPKGVVGRAIGAGVTFGLYGRGTSKNTIAVVGDATKNGDFGPNTTGVPTGVAAGTDRSGADTGVSHAHGVIGVASASSGEAYGVAGQSSTPDGAAVRGSDLDGNGLGVLSDGDSKTNGNHTVTGHVDANEGYRGNVGASAYVGSSHSVAAGNQAIVQYDTVDVEDRGEFDPNNHTFDPKYAGDYHVNAVVEVGLVPEGERVQLELYQDGVREAVSKHYGPTSGGARMTIAVTKTLKGVNAGELIKVDLDNHTSDSLTISDLNHFSHIEITQLG